MKYFKINRTQFIEKPIDIVFSFFSKPENLEQITPEYLQFKILNDSPIPMEKGLIINYKMKIRKIPITWSSLIKSYEPPFSFIDEQIKGPYAFWHHEHKFIEEKGGTRVNDCIKYKIPCGFLGRLINKFWVANDLEKIFNFRKNAINDIFINRIELK